MPIEITMPALSPTMTEGTLAKWLKKEGDEVKAGDVIAEIETDKATMEVEAVDEGKLGKIVVQAGTEGVKVNEVIALLLEEGESAADLGSAKPAPKADAPKAEAPKTEASKTEAHKAEAPKAEAASAPNGDGAKAAGERVFATPLAKRLAAEANIDLKAVSGSGPHGRIVKADIEAAGSKPAAGKPAAPQAAPAPAAAGVPAPQVGALTKEKVQQLAGGIAYDFLPHTTMRKVIARRLTESKQTVPHFYLTVDCEIDELLKIRTELNAKGENFKLSVNDMIIRAAAIALRKVPEANASWSDEGALLWKSVDVAVAVAIEGGLITPIVKNADQKGLATISNEMKDLGARAKAGKLKPEEFQGGTFSISNLGMFGIKDFAAVINPPHGAILAVGAGEQRAVVKNGALAIATVMSCTLSVDHRVVDGAAGANFLKVFKKLIEEPLSMLL